MIMRKKGMERFGTIFSSTSDVIHGDVV